MLIVLGNVSFYNEIDGKGILFILIIGVVGFVVVDEEEIIGEVCEGYVVLVVGVINGYLG